MTQEEKELLLKDLCARLPYGVICKCYHTEFDEWSGKPFVANYNETLENIDVNGFFLAGGFSYEIDEIKPYLRPISTMTEEERKELQKITNNNFYASSNYISNSNSPIDGEWRASYNNFVTNAVCNKLVSWLDKNHFDHRTDEEGKTLIEKGLAIEVTKENNPYKAELS